MMKIEKIKCGKVDRILLNNENGNLFNESFIDELLEKMESAISSNSEIIEFLSTDRVFFSKGPDLESLQRLPLKEAAILLDRLAGKLNDFIIMMRKTEKLTIVGINGAAFGGGLNIFLSANIRFVTKKAKILENFSDFGLPLDLSASILLPKYIGVFNTQKLIYEPTLLTGEQAYNLGIFHECLSQKKDLLKRIDEFEELSFAHRNSIVKSNQLLFDDLETFRLKLEQERKILIKEFKRMRVENE